MNSKPLSIYYSFTVSYYNHDCTTVYYTHTIEKPSKAIRNLIYINDNNQDKK